MNEQKNSVFLSIFSQRKFVEMQMFRNQAGSYHLGINLETNNKLSKIIDKLGVDGCNCLLRFFFYTFSGRKVFSLTPFLCSFSSIRIRNSLFLQAKIAFPELHIALPFIWTIAVLLFPFKHFPFLHLERKSLLFLFFSFFVLFLLGSLFYFR